MSKTAVIVIVFSSILLVCLIGIGIIVGIGYTNRGDDGSLANLFGSGIEVNESENLELDGVSKLVVDCVSGDIDVIKSEAAKVTLTGNIWTTEDMSDFLKVYKEGDTVTVKFDIKTKPFTITNSNIDMSVFLPEDSDLNVEIKSSSGDVKVSDLDFENLDIDSTSGRTTVSNCEGDELSIDKSSGDTNIEYAVFSALDIDSTSGDIEVTNTPADITLDSTSGDTNLSGITGLVDLRSTSGRVSLSIDGTQPEAVNINSISGDVKLYMDSGAQFELTAKATSGDINTDFEIMVKRTDNDFTKSLEGRSGEGGSIIAIRTTSGDIDLKEK